MSQAYDQQQQGLVDAASKALSCRQDVLEENYYLIYALQVHFAWDLCYFFVCLQHSSVQHSSVIHYFWSRLICETSLCSTSTVIISYEFWKLCTALIKLLHWRIFLPKILTSFDSAELLAFAVWFLSPIETLLFGMIGNNRGLPWTLQVVEQEKTIYVQNLMPMLAEYDLQPPVSDAHSMVSHIKVCVKQSREVVMWGFCLGSLPGYTTWTFTNL